MPEVSRLYGHLDAFENIKFFERLNGTTPSDATVTEALASLSFPKEASRRPLSTYSKGMRQKVVIAMGLVKRADVFLLDEPTSGLDPLSARQLRGAIDTLRARGAAILIASHDAHNILAYSDRIALLRDGHLVSERASGGMSQDDVERYTRSLERVLAALVLAFAGGGPMSAQQGRSEAQLRIDVEHAELKEQLSRELLIRKRTLAKQGLLSEADLKTAEAELRLAELETMRAQISYTNELPSFRIVAARKSAPQGGRLTVALSFELPRIPAVCGSIS